MPPPPSQRVRDRFEALADSRFPVAAWLVVVLAGLGALVAAMVPAGPPWLSGAGAVAVASAYTWALAARIGGRPMVFGGLALALGIAVLLSSDRRAIRLRIVGAAFALQAGIAILVLYSSFGKVVLGSMSGGVANLLGYSQKGTEFLFGKMATPEIGGQSFAIGGLISNTTRNGLDKFPGLGDLPVLGTLFRSTNFRRSESELVIIITPYLVRPVSTARLATPLDGRREAGDLERIFAGRLARLASRPGAPDLAGASLGRLAGPAGFVLD